MHDRDYRLLCDGSQQGNFICKRIRDVRMGNNYLICKRYSTVLLHGCISGDRDLAFALAPQAFPVFASVRIGCGVA